MKVVTEIELLEVNGTKVLDLTVEEKKFVVESHWNYNDRLFLKYNGVELLVSARDMKIAIDKAQNHS